MAGLREMATVAARLARVHGVGTAAALIGRKWLRKLRHERLPNTPEANREIWDTHDWSKGGDEWTPSPEWKDASSTTSWRLIFLRSRASSKSVPARGAGPSTC